MQNIDATATELFFSTRWETLNPVGDAQTLPRAERPVPPDFCRLDRRPDQVLSVHKKWTANDEVLQDRY